MRLVVAGMVMILGSSFAWGEETWELGVGAGDSKKTPVAKPSQPQPVGQVESIKSQLDAKKADSQKPAPVQAKEKENIRLQVIREQAEVTQIETRLAELKTEQEAQKDQLEWLGTKENRDKEIKKLESALASAKANVDKTQKDLETSEKNAAAELERKMNGNVESQVKALNEKIDNMQIAKKLSDLDAKIARLQGQINSLKDGGALRAKLEQFVNSQAFCSRAAACAAGTTKYHTKLTPDTLAPVAESPGAAAPKPANRNK